MRRFIDKISSLLARFSQTFFYRHLLGPILIICLTIAQSGLIQIGGIGLKYLDMSFTNIVIEASILFAVDALIAALCGRWWPGFCATSIFSLLYGIANHYTLELHGCPLTLRELENTGAALSVLGSYSLYIDYGILIMVGIFLCCAAAVLILRGIERRKEAFPLIRFKRGDKKKSSAETVAFVSRIVIASLSVAFVYFSFFSAQPFVNIKDMSSSWILYYNKCGCLSSLIEDELIRQNIFVMPDGYDAAEVDRLAASLADGDSSRNGATPDIIYILNETLFDLEYAMDITTDRENPFSALYSRDDVISGRSIVCDVGGGTNKSEFELLTGNSMSVIPGVTPFNTLNITNTYSIVSHLNALGYTTLGSHSQVSSTYQRGYAYSALGFDRTCFDSDFVNRTPSFGKRYYTDESLYENLINWYDSMDEAPRFEYLLTMQNHGGYDMLSESDYTYHVAGDDPNAAEINEFLTSVDLSVSAFTQLIDHFRDSDRPVVILMTGDHAPSFISKVFNKNVPEDEKQLLSRSTPYFVWSNTELDRELIPETVSLHNLSACVLNSAGVQLTGYERYIAELSRDYPVFTSYSSWMTADGAMHSIKDEPLPEPLRDYLFLEYNSMGDKDGRRDEIFTLS